LPVSRFALCIFIVSNTQDGKLVALSIVIIVSRLRM